jgi:hypothetical protein
MLSEKQKKLIYDVIHIVGESSNDWFEIKNQIIFIMPPNERKNFSRRHYSTKKHILNDFDRAVINFWEKETGVKLFIDPEKLHPDDWGRKPRGWALAEINETRKKEKLEKGNTYKSDASKRKSPIKKTNQRSG